MREHGPLSSTETMMSVQPDDRQLWSLIALYADCCWQEDAEQVCISVHCHSCQGHKLFWQQIIGTRLIDSSAVKFDSKAQRQEYLELRSRHQAFRNVVFRIYTAEQVHYLSVSGVPLFDADGKLAAYQCIGTDTSRQKDSEARLQRFRAAMDTSMDMIYLVDRETLRFVDVNNTACLASGISREQLLRTGPVETLGVEENELISRYDKLITQGGSSRIETQMVNRNGRKVTMEVVSRAAQIDGRWIIIGMSRDITQRKTAENRALRLHQLFSALNETNEAILRARSVNELYQNICDAVVNGDKFTIATVVEPIESGWFRARARAGLAPTPEDVRISTDAGTSGGQGISGLCWRSGRPSISNDFLGDPRLIPWKDLARKQNVASGAAFPLFRRRKIVAILLFYASVKNVFDEEIINLLESVAENASYALDSFANEEDRKIAEQQIRESEARFRSLTSLSSDFYWEQNASLQFTKYDGRVLGENNAKALASLIGKPLWKVPGLTSDSMSWEHFQHMLNKQEKFRDFEFSFTNNQGESYHFSLSGEPIFNSQGQFTGYRGISRDVTEKKRISNHVTYLATHDNLTGLPNRVMFSEILTQASKTAARYPEQAFALLFIDLDRFKSINDTYGHQTGDSLLIEVAKRLQCAIRASDVVARLGGDEFVILLQQVTEREAANRIAANILATFEAPLDLNGRECLVSASIGISIYGDDAANEETLMKHADAAMYVAKEEGRNNYQFYSEQIHRQTQEKVDLEMNLRGAVDRGEMSLSYQAKININTGMVTGVEALLRWQSPVLGEVAPDRFIPVAEENGMILPLGDWAIENACRQMMRWRLEMETPLALAVNLSARQFNDPELLAKISRVLSETGFPANRLELEITESTVIHNPEKAIALMNSIKGLGVKLALDDFGTGYSSLGQLKNYPLDTLKIDRAFISDIPANEQDKAISKAIISMGKTLGMAIVAEGVETAAQLRFLQQQHCDQIQGYLINRPAAADDFLHWLLHYLPEELCASLPHEDSLLR